MPSFLTSDISKEPAETPKDSGRKEEQRMEDTMKDSGREEEMRTVKVAMRLYTNRGF